MPNTPKVSKINTYARLPGYETLNVAYGDIIYLPRIEFMYEGPPTSLYVCWAPKRREAQEFADGVNIPGGLFGFVQLTINSTYTSPTLLSFDIPSTEPTIRVKVTEDIHTDPGYNSWIWASSQASPIQLYHYVLDDDANVFNITLVPQVTGLEVGYAIL